MISMQSVAKIAVLRNRSVLEQRWSFGLNAFDLYVEEVLAHAGIAYETLEEWTEDVHSRYDAVIVTVSSETQQEADALTAYMHQGGIIINCSGLNKLGGRLGFVRTSSV